MLGGLSDEECSGRTNRSDISMGSTSNGRTLKALVWQDASGDTWLSYNDPGWIAKRHGLSHEVDATVNATYAALDGIARTATTSP
jgi:hypothetical protein